MAPAFDAGAGRGKRIAGRTGVDMTVTYFKRYRMEFELARLFREPDLPLHYRLLRWDESLLMAHADAKYRSFRSELDANVFPCLGDREGCRRLMGEIARRNGFVRSATWLIQWCGKGDEEREYCGTIQGIVDFEGIGSIQNLGITPGHRGRGLGSCLLYHALAGFREHGLRRATLEVTAQNSGAIRLYQRLGFRRTKTVYKAAEVACG
ncbi:MAG: Mycothiol acetyltransferase [Planctomycetota bacterium]|jgi:ribosomal protein S18 acetylase RimI-like enzyme